MVTSCFFCQNLLSDYIEAILPPPRYGELKTHLEKCGQCKETREDLVATIDVLHDLSTNRLPKDITLRILESSERRKTSSFTRSQISKFVLLAVVPMLIFGSVIATFPTVFPWVTKWTQPRTEDHFVSYYPLFQGAAEILEEQGNWIQMRDSLGGSLWEEGGLSPEEFEKTFQLKSLKSDGK